MRVGKEGSPCSPGRRPAVQGGVEPQRMEMRLTNSRYSCTSCCPTTTSRIPAACCAHRNGWLTETIESQVSCVVRHRRGTPFRRRTENRPQERRYARALRGLRYGCTFAMPPSQLNLFVE
jgi:hypothetical protein